MREGKPRLVVVQGEDRGQEVELPQGEVRIGRGRSADIMVNDLSVSRHHVTLFFDGRRVRVRDEGSGNGTSKNGAPLEGEAELVDGDELELGDTIFKLAFPRVMVEPSGSTTSGVRRGGGGGAVVGGTVRTRQPERDLKPLIMVIGGVLAVAVTAVVAVSVLTGGREPPPAAAPTIAPVAAPPSQPPPIVISMPMVAAPDAGAAATKPPRPPRPVDRDRNNSARDRDRDRDGDRERDFERSREAKPVGVARAAQEMYEEEDFAGAARTLRDAGDSELASVAKDYATVGAGLARGDANASSAPMVALAAYQEALAADVRSGGSAHATSIREKLGTVAPAAAKAFFDTGRYESARAACDMAVNFRAGGDPRVAQTRELLEGAAADLYKRAQALEDSDPDEAKLLYRRIVKIVPSGNEWSRKALDALRG